MRFFKRGFLVIGILLAGVLAGCDLFSNDPEVIDAGRVHIVGTYGSWNTAFYWNNGTREILDAPDGDYNVSATSVTVDEGVVYAGGAHNGIPCYWVDGVRNDLGTEAGEITSIAVDGSGRLILAGQTGGDPVVYIDGVKSVLSLPEGYAGGADAMVLEGSLIYTAGHYQDESWSDQGPCYWIDGEYHELPMPGTTAPGGSARVTGMVLAEESLFISGSYDSFADNTGAGFWLDGVWNDLDGTSAWTIASGGNSVYVAGRDSDGACYWKNGQKTRLQCTFSTLASAAAVSGTEVVFGGKGGSIGQSDVLGYWFDGAFTEILEYSVADITGLYITD